MAYIGQRPSIGNIRKLDNFSANFNGITKEFPATVLSEAINLNSVNQMIVSINDNILEPGVDFTIGTSRITIVFTVAPSIGSQFWAIILGDALNVGSVADDSVTADKLTANSVTTSKIANTAVTTAKIAELNITTQLLANNSVSSGKIQDLSITSAKIANNAVTSTKIQDASITGAKISGNAIDTSKIIDGAITLPKLVSTILGTEAEMETETASKLVLASLAKYLPGMAKAWVNFDGLNGSLTVPILKSGYNIASLSRVATGRYTVTFATPMANVDYCVITNAVQSLTGTNIGWQSKARNKTVNGFDIVTGSDGSTSGSLNDAAIVTAVVYGAM